MNQAAVDDLPPGPAALGGGNLIFVSPVLGCRVIAKADPDYESQRLAERILAGIEALFATSLDEEIFPYREELTIEIRCDVAHQGAPMIEHEASIGSAAFRSCMEALFQTAAMLDEIGSSTSFRLCSPD